MSVHSDRFAAIQMQLKQGDLIAAADAIDAWRAAEPASADALACRAHWLRLLGRFDEAAAALEPALAATPPCAAAWAERARLDRLAGQAERAHAAFDAAHRADPAATAWLAEWIELLHPLHRPALALPVAQALCEHAPDSAQSWFLLGLTHHYAGDYAAAAAAYRRADALDPAYPMLRNNLAALRYQTGMTAEALALAEAAIRAEPDNQMAWCNCSNAWLALREPARALIAGERACALGPNYAIAQLARANALKELQRWPDALAAAAHAHRSAPDDPVMQWSLAMLQLLHGDYANGWANHEARWNGSRELGDRPRPSPQQQWRGEPLAGKTLMLWGEQGFGDALQFARFAPIIAEQATRAGAQVVFACFAGLEPLFARSFAGAPMRIVRHDAPQLPAFDHHLPVGSAPLLLGVRPDTIPAAGGYLRADPARAAQWAARRPADGRLRVGLVWSGSRTHQRNPLRAIDPAACARAWRDLTGVAFHSLQIDGAADVATMRAAGLDVIDHTAELPSFDDTAAYLSSLDLVVTVCTSVAHLAGALGRPTRLLLDVNPHWVWMIDREDSPWYGSLRLYRQPRYRDWTTVLDRVRDELAALAAART
ncbi:tetratricopeptide repeat protein [Burkholderia pseudomallei]|uniref:tetratricopeptide repeat protein n=1 Tax=Burkholderia pseudomallei TaxID=28450 RepID=UPI0018C62ABA|nr:tetratricopeptide repeat protein [Burkholderia pseudomallei]MBG1245740.1 tetratricopeptide repeat protein [Burkholderia pseudomallei]